MIAIGSFTTYNGVGRNRIARLNSDGGLDISYNPDIAFSFDPIAIALQPDGKALVHASVDGSARLLRLNGDGSSDGSFTAPAWGQLDKVYSIRILPDGKILMAGCTVSSGTLSSQARISRLHANGSLDESFDSGVAGVDWQQSPGTCICDVSVLGSGEILVAGRFDTFNGSPRRAIVRLLPDGSVDNGWSSDHPAPSTIRTVLVQRSGGKIVSFGDYSTALFAIPGLGVALSQVNDIARLTEDGAQDDAFDSATEVVDVYYMALQTDGKILIVGDFSSYNGVPRSRIARLLGDPSGVGLGETLPRKFGDLLLFPNPSDGQLKLHLELTGLVYIQVFDPLGRQVHNEVFQASGAKTVRTLDLSELAKGCYTLVAKNDQGTVSQRVVLE
ncbi:MAG TPA: T9SS type A sorting domain-containing protein [Flavobacteriales bacterium]|nr:T9SS type A sorting domain-containing protein [Flavobacteriales bacterium]